jgi:hypothetical protein
MKEVKKHVSKWAKLKDEHEAGSTVGSGKGLI